MGKITARILPLVAAILLLAGCTAEVKTDQKPDRALEQSIHTAVLSENTDVYSKGNVQVESHHVLGISEKGDALTVYVWVLYQEYACQGGALVSISGGHTPNALTFRKDAQDGYRLTEYWTAEDGSGYASSIKRKFPQKLWGDAFDSQKFIRAQQKDCDAQANAQLSTVSRGGTA